MSIPSIPLNITGCEYPTDNSKSLPFNIALKPTP